MHTDYVLAPTETTTSNKWKWYKIDLMYHLFLVHFIEQQTNYTHFIGLQRKVGGLCIQEMLEMKGSVWKPLMMITFGKFIMENNLFEYILLSNLNLDKTKN